MVRQSKIAINGETVAVAARAPIADVLAQIEETAKEVIVVHNGTSVPHARFEAVRVKTGDRVDLITPNFGG